MKVLSLFVTGTDTGIGKTFVSCALLYGFCARYHRVAAFKPIAAGAVLRNGVWHNEDTDLLLEASNVALQPHLATPYLLRESVAPNIGAAHQGVPLDISYIQACYYEVVQLADVVIVEGVGGVCVPLDEILDTSDLATVLKLPILLVVGLKLGCINHALLSAEAIAARGLVLSGWIANTVDPDMAFPTENIEAIKCRLDRQYGAPLLGIIPHLDGQYSDKSAVSYINIDALLKRL
ncbi:dethiobiotin synthase [Candidatus Vallotia tarda]|uniref:ATP-dependent dethiobiotin synthetase BioD n=1 Tax=Candidatus Vallotiella hemipterorum TaxID=1177213 RepID=A0A916JT95_9BURK|nr:dethiobiotin synthase [Candidatus Vallotia tarda]CAG7595830.1 ATP-dependent dethiobiotin synthetase BioD [Candidatus Vallotia tarda]